VTGEIPSVRSYDPRLPGELDPVFSRALAKEPTWRFRSGAEFVAALRAAFDRAAGATAVLSPARTPQRGPSPRLLVLAAALILAGIAGAVAAALLSRSDTPKTLPPARPSVSVRTVTETTPASTIVTTATAPTTSAAPQSSDPNALNDQAYQDMQQQNYAAALPLLQQAVQELQGQSSTVAGYANYNLGVTLIALGQCDEAMQYLEAAQQIEPDRHEVHDAMKAARQCSSGPGKGNGNGNGG
jgi:tetratricopeptide (TPR) repeat protein